MAGIQNVSAVDYRMPVIQPQNENVENIQPAIDNAPVIYNPELEERQRGSSNLLGKTLLGLGTAGLGFLAGRYLHKKSNNNDIEKVAKEINDACKGYTNDVWVVRAFNTREFAERINKIIEPYLKNAEKNAKGSEK